MKTNILRSVALALGLCTCGVAQAQYGNYPAYQSGPQPQLGSGFAQVPQSPPSSVPVHPSLRALPPAGPNALNAAWGGSQYQPAPSNVNPQPAFGQAFQPVGTGGGQNLTQPLPQPTHVPHSGGYPSMQAPVEYQNHAMPMQGGHAVMPSHQGHVSSVIEGDCQSCGPTCGPELCSPGIMPIRKWFAGSSLLFLDFESDYNRRLVFPDAMPSNTMLETAMADPGSQTGFETFVGHYFGCGKYALVGSYFFLNPGMESVTVQPPAAGDYRAAYPLWDRLYIDRDNDNVADDVGNLGDNTDDHLYGVYDAATALRIRRDVEFQGAELSMVCFGIGGASRVGSGCNPCGPGCGGMGGPLSPSCSSRVQMQFSHGFRWFRFKDDFEFAASATDWVYGTGIDDYYNDTRITNDLLGYQIGSRINYCILPRVNVYAGGKFGLYSNQVDYYARFGTRGAAAQVTAAYPTYQDQRMEVSRSETVLSSLGELDLGVGVRLTNCWTLTGGYRLLGVTGVATSVGSIASDPAHLVQGHLPSVNDSFLLHGGYFGIQYNW